MTYVEIPLDGGGRLVVEVEPAEAEEIQRAGRAGRALRQAGSTLQAAITSVTPAVESIARKLRDIENPPDRLELTFGIKISGEADVAIAKTSSEAQFQVVLEWGQTS
ncbi:CU044_2847 family protein [Nonomuraea endophytica]|uniref:CU044_2847 family protein n=1 Tax=Nonomuraea endophytica TaxID=714136 RepID=UPI0037C81658